MGGLVAEGETAGQGPRGRMHTDITVFCDIGRQKTARSPPPQQTGRAITAAAASAYGDCAQRLQGAQALTSGGQKFGPSQANAAEPHSAE